METTWADFPERDVEKIAKGWSKAMLYSKDRLRKVYKLGAAELETAVNEGRLVLENICLFVHACVKQGQYKLPMEFWRLLHAEFGIVVYPSALTEAFDTHGVGVDVTFTDIYCGHIVLLGKYAGTCPPPDPFDFLQEPPPVYRK